MKQIIKQIIIQYIPIWVIYKVRYLSQYFWGYKEVCKELESREKNKRKIIIIDLPEHGNLGDQAIALSELQFLEETLDLTRNLIYSWYLEDFVKHWLWLKKNIGNEDIILCHGGGNIGDVYVKAEFVRQIVVHEFPNNKIIILPQTCYFTDSKFGNTIKMRSKEIYSKHPNLIICAREETSFLLLRSIFSENEIILVPDMVLNYAWNRERNEGRHEKKNVAMFCMRNDSEKAISDETIEQFKEICVKKGFTIKKTDTMFKGNLKNITEAKIKVDEKISEFANCKLVITDRLHGMVLTALAGTNCIVISNNNHKVYGVYRWIEKIPNIVYLQDVKKFNEVVKELMCCDTIDFFYPNMDNGYAILKEKLLRD